MIHEAPGPDVGVEPGDDLFGVHAELDELERDAAADRFLLFGHINHTATAFANLLRSL